MSPAEIQIMFHFYTCKGPLFLCENKCHTSNESSDLKNEFIQGLASRELLKLHNHEGLFKLTDKGLVYCKALVAMPLPETDYRVQFTFINDDEKEQ